MNLSEVSSEIDTLMTQKVINNLIIIQSSLIEGAHDFIIPTIFIIEKEKWEKFKNYCNNTNSNKYIEFDTSGGNSGGIIGIYYGEILDYCKVLRENPSQEELELVNDIIKDYTVSVNTFNMIIDYVFEENKSDEEESDEEDESD